MVKNEKLHCGLNKTISYTYGGAGEKLLQTNANGTRTEYFNDNLYQLTKVVTVLLDEYDTFFTFVNQPKISLSDTTLQYLVGLNERLQLIKDASVPTFDAFMKAAEIIYFSDTTNLSTIFEKYRKYKFT